LANFFCCTVFFPTSVSYSNLCPVGTVTFFSAQPPLERLGDWPHTLCPKPDLLLVLFPFLPPYCGLVKTGPNGLPALIFFRHIIWFIANRDPPPMFRSPPLAFSYLAGLRGATGGFFFHPAVSLAKLMSVSLFYRMLTFAPRRSFSVHGVS